MTQILPRLWLGSAEDAWHGGFLQRKGITHIVCCAAELMSLDKYPHDVAVERFLLEDDDYPAAEVHLRLAAGKVEEWMHGGFTVLVHCRAGVSRSPAVVMAWLILYNRMSYDDAYGYVAKAHKIARPNDAFCRILKALAQH